MLWPMRTGLRVGSELGGLVRIAQVGNGGFRIFDAVSEGEISGRTPRPAVVEVKDVPSRAPDRLRQIQVALVAGESMQQDDGRVRACSGGDVNKGVQQGAVTGKLEGLHRGGVGFIRRAVREDSGILGDCGGDGAEGCGEQGRGEQDSSSGHAVIVDRPSK